jgi:hypothetical protein
MKTNAEYSDLGRDILHTISYFDVFSYPLTKNQIHRFLNDTLTTIAQVQEELDLLTTKNLIRSSSGYYYSADRNGAIVSERIENERRASRMLRQARWISFFLKQIPFVRAVFITGSLSKHVAPHKSDIDFMIVTELDRLWVCKMILTGFRRIFLLNSKKYFCINLMITEKAIYFPHHNYYTAIEIATTQVVWNTAAFSRYQKENSWVHEYLPNWRFPAVTVVPLSNKPSLLQRWLEGALNLFHLDKVNINFMHTARKFWRTKHDDIEETQFNSIIQCTPDISSVWHDDHQTQILTGFRRRLETYGIKEAV